MPRNHRHEMLVELEDVRVSRDGRNLIEGVSFGIGKGEIVTLIGPNGSGKSTTAKVITGVIRPDGGRVTRRTGLKIGYVPQKLSIDWTLPLTVGRLMTLTGKVPAGEIDKALEAAGISHLRNAAVQRLSGGEFQRALLARAIARKPELLVLDEPVQGVDFAGEVALYQLITRIRDLTGCGILLISHDLHVVMAQTDTVVCLNQHVCCRGTPQSVIESPEYLRLFGTRAADTLAIYSHHHDHTHLPDGRVRLANGTVVDGEDHKHGREFAHGHGPQDRIGGH